MIVLSMRHDGAILAGFTADVEFDVADTCGCSEVCDEQS